MVYICFKAMKEGFINEYRSFIGIDDCHLKGPFRRVFLSVMVLNNNNGLFPIAYIIVECENKETLTMVSICILWIH